MNKLIHVIKCTFVNNRILKKNVATPLYWNKQIDNTYTVEFYSKFEILQKE